MPKTAVGLFTNPDLVENVVRQIEALGLARNEVRTLEEPKTFEINGVMSFPRLDFEVQVKRALAMIGATQVEAQTYLDGLRRGGALVFATGSDEKVDQAAEILNRNGAVGTEESSGREPDLPHVPQEVRSSTGPLRNESDLAGFVGRIPPRGVGYFAW